jgi:8-oxo-dGTP diphosphatase
VGIPDDVVLRCSAVVLRRRSVLLIHRTYEGVDNWVLPGGTPRAGESMAACARREVREETGLLVDPSRVAFVLEVIGPDESARTVDMVFAATEAAPGTQPEVREPGMMPVFVPVEQVQELDLRPPVAGHLRGLLGSGGRRYAPYLANMWRPVGGPATAAGGTAASDR